MISSTNIPFLNLRDINLKFKKEFETSFQDILNDGWFILGKRLTEFEKDYAQFNATKHCLGVANGLDALILALKALGIGEGDEVIVPSNTFIASWLAVSYVGATPVPVEPRLDTYNLDPALIEAKITPRTKAIMPVNLYGQAAELSKIVTIANRHNLFVLEDNAQAQGATCDGKITGSFGHISATSFYPGKNLGALGDGGAITTDSDEYASILSSLRNYGSTQKYLNDIKGVNSRLDELQAAFLSIKLKQLDDDNQTRIQIARMYANKLKGVGDIILPQLAENCTSVYHLFVIRTNRRDEIHQYLASKNIGTVIHYPIPPHLQKAYSELGYKKGDFPIAEEIADTCLSLPIYPGLTEGNVDTVINTIQMAFNSI